MNDRERDIVIGSFPPETDGRFVVLLQDPDTLDPQCSLGPYTSVMEAMVAADQCEQETNEEGTETKVTVVPLYGP